MRVIKPMVIVEDDLGMLMPNGLTLAQHMAKKIEMATRQCYLSEGRMTETSYEKFLEGVFQGKHHTGIAEHRMISITFITDRGVSHEGVRHRMAAYLQESTRYCDYTSEERCPECFGKGRKECISELPEGDSLPCTLCNERGTIPGKSKGMTFILPPWVQPSFDPEDLLFQEFIESLKVDEERYNWWRKHGWKPEQVRGFLPHFVKTKYTASKNLGSWWNWCAKRAHETAHPQMRQLAIPVLRYFQRHLPMFFRSVPMPTGAWSPDYDPAEIPETPLFTHKGERYPEAKLVIRPFYDDVPLDEVYAD